MSNKLLAGLLVGTAFLATSLTAPAQAKNDNCQNVLNQQATQMYQQNLLSQQYSPYGQYGYGQYDIGAGIGAPGIDPRDPQAWQKAQYQKAQYQKWLQAQQAANSGYMNHGFNNGVKNAHINANRHFNNTRNLNQGWNGQVYRNNVHR